MKKHDIFPYIIIILAIIFISLIFILHVYFHKKGELKNTNNYFSINTNDKQVLNNEIKPHIYFLSTNYSNIGNWWYCQVGTKKYFCPETTETPKTDEEKRAQEELNKKIQEDTKNIAIYFALKKAGYTEYAANLKINHEYSFDTGEKIDNTYSPLSYKDEYKNIITNKTRVCDKNMQNCFNITENIIEDETIKPKINIEYIGDSKFGGNSSGLMWALYLYSQISKEKLGEKHSHIAGTGSLHSSGDIGSVGGIKAKVEAAYTQNVDVIFVPKLPALYKGNKSNCEEAHSVPKDKNVKTQIVCVNHFDEVLEYLK